MIWTQAVFLFIAGLAVVSSQNASGKDILSLKADKPGNKNDTMLAPLADNFLYTLFACRNKQNGLRLPIAGSCVDYFECNNGRTVRKTCEKGFLFSNHGLACLDPRISQCRPEQKEIACEGPCCTREDGLYPAEDGCSNFYICISGHSYRRTCGDILQFDSINLICDIPERARCSKQIEMEVVEVVEDKSNEVVKSEEATISRAAMYMISHRVCKSKPDGYSVPIPGSCNKFYMCVAGLGYLKSCGRMQFNTAKHYCDLKTRMYCPDDDEDELILDNDEDLLVDGEPEPTPEEDSEDGEKPYSPPQSVDEPNRGDKKPKPIAGDEDESLESVDEQQMLEEIAETEEDQPLEPVRPGARPSYSKPSEEEELPSKDTAAATHTNVCADQPVGALMPLTGECANYIRCRWDWFERRTAEVLACPDGMHFNPRTKYCDWAENVNCKVNADLSSRTIKKTKKPQKGSN